MIIIILAGGKGVRLWPFSSQESPKQFLKIKNHKSLLQNTYLRFANLPFIEQIIVVTNDKYKNLVEEHLSEIGASCPIICEPVSRNTAPAICLAMKYIQEKLNSSLETSKVLISPSDHLIFPESRFQEYLKLLQESDLQDNLVTFGIRPTKPETGYGYIKVKAEQNHILYSTELFIEKPSLDRAQQFLLQGDYLWNSGIFLFSISTFISELKQHCIELYNAFNFSYASLIDFFHHMPNISLDYALLEKTKNIKTFPLDLSWSDVGSWDSIYDVLEKDENLNVKQGKVYDIETKNCLILAKNQVISAVGLENLIIVESEKGIFIGKRGFSQKIKDSLDSYA